MIRSPDQNVFVISIRYLQGAMVPLYVQPVLQRRAMAALKCAPKPRIQPLT